MTLSIKLKNAHMMIIEVALDEKHSAIQVTFADGVEGKIPLADIKPKGKLDLSHIELPDPYGVVIGIEGSDETTGFPWDFARSYCDPAFKQQGEQRWEADRRRLAGNVKRLRQRKDWTQDKLATVSGVNRVTVARIETVSLADVRLSTIEKLASAFDVEVGALFKLR